MPPPIRAPTGLPSRKNQSSSTRPLSTRAGSMAPPPSLNRLQSAPLSPANSIASSRPISASPQAGVKRKQRDFDMEGTEETNIHVVVRCRGRNDREVRENSGVVVSTEGAKGKSVELSMGPNALSNKTYRFDKVFSPAADQAMIYEDVVSPILEEMLQGFNCTVFAYGQTGTGKTYTMSGDMTDTLGLLSDAAGIIPRVLHFLFRKLEADGSECSIKCSFIELYNEELRDLLAVDENTKLKLFEDGQKKGHNATIVQGMEESHIKTAHEGIQLLQEGSHKRQVAATKCNDLSSRSHTVFTITAYIKRTSDTGEDFLCSGKLNLVDLAGSENIQRSGAENKRAAEAGLINKSLLTLGRVINALVDKNSHIPYRESKLTRLLQDSLGGRTKTCIIATISPAKSNLEETISTLDYAFRAKNIKNKPQMNQMIEKKTLLKEFTAEIEKLKSELIATRQRNGVYLTNEIYEEIKVESESRRILTEEQKAKIETMEANLRNKVQELFTLTNNFATLKKDNESTRQALDDTKGVLQKTEIVLADTRQNLAEETILRKAHQATEEDLSAKGGKLISTLDKTVKDVEGLRAKIKRKSDLQSLNRTNWQSSQGQVFDVTKVVEDKVGEFQSHHKQLLENLSTRLQEYVSKELESVLQHGSSVSASSKAFQDCQGDVAKNSSKGRDEMNEVLEEIKVLREDVKKKVGEGLQGLSAAAGQISAGVIEELDRFHTELKNSYTSLGKEMKSIFNELTKHLKVQKAEAEALREQLATATTLALDSDERVSFKLESCLEEERKQATADRESLLTQITTLIHANGAAQEQRLSNKISTIRDEMNTARSELRVAEQKYSTSMDQWSLKESGLVDEVLKSRETLKKKLQKDWETVEKHSTSIEATTKSVHGETVRIVEAQMADMAVQMRALDDFVTRARNHNDRHQASQSKLFERLSSTVVDSYDFSIRDLKLSQESLNIFNADLMSQTSALAVLPSNLTSTIQNPLTSLREDIASAPLTEYSSTGITPQKTTYTYPRNLPRTRLHDELLGKTAPAPPESAILDVPDLLEDAVPVSPSKANIYTDASPQDTCSTTTRPATADSAAGLREVSINLGPLSPIRRSDPASSLAGAPPHPDFRDRGNKTEDLSKSLSHASSLMRPPPLKRLATDTTGVGSKLPKGTKVAARMEGRENMVPFEGFSRSLGSGRRLRSNARGS